jgi:murein DD-endopeptidase MepM/ murein hydrolase activator NlpD
VSNLAGLHDLEGSAIAPPDTWLLDTVALSDHPQPKRYPTSLNIIARLNWGYGSSGTLPLPSVYEAFAQKVAQYVSGSRGCRRWIIGNECNLSREWPDNQPIYPWNYAACYKLCREAIHALPGHQQDEVLIAASGPWNAELKYNSNKDGDWITYFTDVITLIGAACDGYSIHTYTHGYDVNLVTSSARMDRPFQDRYYEFYTYRDYCEAIPPNLRHLPVYITEANGNGPWQAVGLMPAMLQEIDTWNHSKLPKIASVIFYRYPRYDQFYIEGRGDVIAEYQTAVARGYQSPGIEPMPPTPPTPTPEPPQPPTPDPEPARDIDPRLIARGVEFDFVTPPKGVGYWRITKAQWLDHAASQVGPDHHILGRIVKDNVETPGVTLRVWWPSGTTTVTSKRDDPNATYNYDYGMGPSLKEYTIQVSDGNPSDQAAGIGMGKDGNPREHTSTWINFEWTISEGMTPPLPPQPGDIETGRVTATAGLNLRRGPGEGFDVLGTLGYGSTVLHDDQQQGWLHVVDGWVSGDYVGPVAEGTDADTQELPAVAGDLVHPLPGSVITQHFYENAPDYARFDLPGHDGTDLGGMAEGTPIGSIAAGIVVDAAVDKDYGNYVVVRHPELDACSLYAHLNEIKVGGGQEVAAGETIGLLGATGNATGPHLHLEIRMMNAGGLYKQNTPMRGGRVDPQTWAYMYGLEL